MICPKCKDVMSEVHVVIGDDMYICPPCGESRVMSFCPLGICPNTTVLKDK